jgi:cell division septation protein DedD
VGTSVKERLTGAAILVALIVLLVPELLRGPVRPVAHPAAASDEGTPLRSYTIKLGDDAHTHGASTPAASGPQQPAPIPANTESSAPAAEPAPAPLPTPAADPAPAKVVPSPPPAEHSAAAQPAPPATTPADAAATSGAFMVQLGSFAKRDNADRLAKQVKGQGFTVSVSRGITGQHLYKVLVGPAHDRAAALQLEAKLHAAGHTGSIVAK